MDLTHRLAEFVVGLRFDDLPTEVIERVKRQWLDLLGVALAGATWPAGAIARAYAERQASAPRCTVWGSEVRASPADAAFANGITAHALDFDDVWLPAAHPTAPTFPAALALAEALGASAKDLLVAQVVGYEVMGRLMAAAGGRAGWHPTAVFGCLGATAAACKLLELDEQRTALAFGIASSEASGISGHSGTMTKPFHAGHAARSGVVAAGLAADGFTAHDHVLDVGGGFFDAFYREVPYLSWEVTAALGNPFYMMSPGIGIKRFPCCHFLQSPSHAALQLVENHGVRPQDIREVEIGVPRAGYFDEPRLQTGLHGKFSIQFVVSSTLVDGNLTIDSFTDELALRQQVKEMMARARLRVDSTIPHSTDLVYNPVTVRLADGRQLTEQQQLPQSHWRYPLKREQWLEKFQANASRVLPPQGVEQLLSAVERVEAMANVRELATLLAAPAVGAVPGTTQVL